MIRCHTIPHLLFCPSLRTRPARPWGKPHLLVHPLPIPASAEARQDPNSRSATSQSDTFDDAPRSAGRPPGKSSAANRRMASLTRAFTVRVTNDERAALDARAGAEERDVSVVIRRALRRYLASPIN